MKPETFAVVFVTLLVAVGSAVFIAGSLAWKSYQCSARWDGSYDVSYGTLAGCRVKIDGKFIPETSVRQF